MKEKETPSKPLELYLDEKPSDAEAKAVELLSIAGLKFEIVRGKFDKEWPKRPFMAHPKHGLGGTEMDLDEIREFARINLFEDDMREKYHRPEQNSNDTFFPTVLCLNDRGERAYKGNINKSPVPLNKAISWNWYGRRTRGAGFQNIYGWDLGNTEDIQNHVNEKGVALWPKAPAALFPDELEKLRQGEDRLVIDESSIPGGYGVFYEAYFVEESKLFRIYAYMLD